MGYQEKNCKSFREFINITLGWTTKNHFVIFRGQGDIKHSLLPGIARTPKNKVQYPVAELLKIEKEIIEEFRVLCNDHISSYQIDKKDELEILSLAQHYGLQTRLLDWTSNPLAALFFSLNGVKEDETEGDVVVWAYCIKDNDRRVLNLKDFQRQKPFDTTCTFIFKPKTVSKRIMAQAGWFTLHSCDSKKGFIPLDKELDFKDELAKIIIPKKYADKLRMQLDIVHVNYSTLFPDISGIAKHLSWKILRKYEDFEFIPVKERY